MEIRIKKIGTEKFGKGYLAFASCVLVPKILAGLWPLWNLVTFGIFSTKIALSLDYNGQLLNLEESFESMEIEYDLYAEYSTRTQEEAQTLVSMYSQLFESKGIYRR